jgi:hypothetical protein
MLDLIKPYNLIEYRREEYLDLAHHDFRIERIDTLSQPVSRMTALGQYFTAACIWLSDQMMIELPAPDDEIKSLILDQVAPHFTEIKMVVAEKEGETIRLQHIKPESKLLFNQADTGAMPIVRDLYRHRGIDQWQQQFKRTLVKFSVDTSKLKPSFTEDLQDLTLLLTRAFLEPGEEYTLMPLGWVLDDQLQESAALLFFASIFPFVSLEVDAATNEIILLQLSKKPFTHQVILREEEANQTRIVDSFLYLYLDRGLVYVVDMSGQAAVEDLKDLKHCTLYQMGAEQRFASFDHWRSERVPDGIGLLFDKDTISLLVDTVNRHCFNE